MKKSWGEMIFNAVNLFLISFLCVATVYPMINTLAKSFSYNVNVASGKVSLFPVGFTLKAYETVLGTSVFTHSLFNTVIVALFGTMLSLVVTLSSAFALSRKDLVGHRGIFLYYLFTMFFNGGIIPNFLLIKDLKLYDTLWALILPGAISVYNMIIAKSFFEQIPESILEAASIDGCNDLKIMIRIVVPMSLPLIATLTLFVSVTLWNNYMNALLYLQSQRNWTLQYYVRQIVTDGYVSMSDQAVAESGSMEAMIFGIKNLSAAVIVLSAMLPIIVYPFLQKFFVKGITLGAVKE